MDFLVYFLFGSVVLFVLFCALTGIVMFSSLVLGIFYFVLYPVIFLISLFIPNSPQRSKENLVSREIEAIKRLGKI